MSKRGFFQSIWFVLTLTCDQSSRILSDAMDRELTGIEKTALRLHNMSCKSCKIFTKQLSFLRKTAPKAALEQDTIPQDSKDRIRESLRKSLDQEK